MTYEQMIEELKKLKTHNNKFTIEQQAEIDANVNAEVAEIDATIEIYNEKIAQLEAKLADESNYLYNNENEERDLTIELLEESFENQLEVLEREDKEYKTLQDLATSIFSDCNLEIATLNNEIAIIERRLRKNDIAVRKNIGIKLTEDELFALNYDLEAKKLRIKECEEMKSKYVTELSDYGKLITENNRKREEIASKQESLNKVKEHRASKVGSIDNAKLRIDKDELASLKAGLVALNTRKDYITYNPNSEIDKLIEAIEQNRNQTNDVVEENKDLNTGVVSPSVDEVKLEDVSNDIVEAPIEDKSQTLIDAYLNGNEDLVEEDEKQIEEQALGIPEETTAHDIWLAGNPDLDIEREAEIEEAPEILKEKKKEGWFKKNWKKWVAAGLATIALIAVLKGCDPKTNTPAPEDLNNNDISHSQTDESVVEQLEKEFNDKYEISYDKDLEKEKEKEEVKDKKEEKEEEVKEKDEEVKEKEEEIKDKEEEIKDKEEEIKDKEEEKEDSKTEIETEPEYAELEQGESITSVENILNGKINDDTVIKHGDEVGKTIDDAELKDYTEEGNAVVEFEKSEEKQNTQINDDEQFIKNLEEFMGGDIAPYEPQWVDEISNEKHVRR